MTQNSTLRGRQHHSGTASDIEYGPGVKFGMRRGKISHYRRIFRSFCYTGNFMIL